MTAAQVWHRLGSWFLYVATPLAIVAYTVAATELPSPFVGR